MNQTHTIDTTILERHSASEVHLDKGQPVFFRGDQAHFFHVVRSGQIKMVRMSEEGREFVQGYFGPGESFGEPPFFVDEPYPATAVAVEPTVVLRLQRDDFNRLLAEHPEIQQALLRALSRRIHYKAVMLGELATGEATHRIEVLIEYLRRHAEEGTETDPYRVPFTRQQLADMTGLRVETTIRAVKSLEEEGLLEIRSGKIVWFGRKEGGQI